jgi:cation diffusion facilitator family transporter
MDRTYQIKKVLILTLLLNLAVSCSKIIYGYFISSVAMISDGFHSLFDGVSNIVGLIGIYLSSHPPDETHPYGHKKYETIFTIFVGLLMFVTCFEIFRKVYLNFSKNYTVTVTTESFIVMMLTICINIFVNTYEKKMGNRLNSDYLLADAKHTKSDIYSSIGVIIALILSRIGLPSADAIVGAIVGIIVAKTGMEIIKESAETLVDRKKIDVSIIKNIACNIEGVIDCHDIRTRGVRGDVFVDLSVHVSSSLSIEEAHKIADEVETRIKRLIPEVVDVVVHIEPDSLFVNKQKV